MFFITLFLFSLDVQQLLDLLVLKDLQSCSRSRAPVVEGLLLDNDGRGEIVVDRLGELLLEHVSFQL